MILGGLTMGQIKITEELFVKLAKLFLFDDNTQYNDCKAGIQDKMDKLCRRELYSIYSNKELSPQEREQARQAYLESKGIPENFRW